MLNHIHYYWQQTMQRSHVSLSHFAYIPQHPMLPLTIRREFYAEGADTGPHKHADFYALYVVQGGQGIHAIDNHPYGIARGDVYMLPPGSTHAYHDFSSLTIDACYFQTHLFADSELTALRSLSGLWNLLIGAELLPNDYTMQEGDFNDHRLHLPPERFHDVEDMLTEIRAEFTSSTPESPILTRALFFRMLVYFARWQPTQTSIPPEKNETGCPGEKRQAVPHKISIANILQLCEERFAEPLSVPQLAALMFLSPSRFTELFSREVGMSPAAYIRRLRLERAQTLLRTTSHSTTSIAHQVGFRDGAQLSRAFHAVFHLTPTAYRNTFN